MYDTKDAGHFARKALKAADGQKPTAEYPQHWNIKFDHQRVKDARKRLNALMARGAVHKAPYLAARAQANFDCWVEQLEEGWQLSHINKCRRHFHKAVLALEHKLTRPFIVHFDVNESTLNTHDLEKVTTLIKEADRLDAPLASVVGYADTTGSPQHNMKLSLDRADQIAKILIDAGYPEEKIARSAYGEKRLAHVTKDNESNRKNRRVEILFYP